VELSVQLQVELERRARLHLRLLHIARLLQQHREFIVRVGHLD
jgi:hypothetical protein